MTKKQRALEIIERLKKEYPDAGCTLDYDQAWKLLVSVRLAAQCTDARVNIVVEKLYEKFPDVDALAEAPVEEIEAIVKPCGLGHSKARDISACMKILRDKYDGKVPDDFDELLSLPGVGRKSANLVMGDVFGRPAIVTDTHCIRLVNRMGLVDGIKEPKKVEMELWKLVPPDGGQRLSGGELPGNDLGFDLGVDLIVDGLVGGIADDEFHGSHSCSYCTFTVYTVCTDCQEGNAGSRKNFCGPWG